MGTIAALLNDGEIYPLEKEEVKIRSNNGAISEAQLISSVSGIPSGPAAELGDSSLIASIITVSLKFMSVKTAGIQYRGLGEKCLRAVNDF